MAAPLAVIGGITLVLGSMLGIMPAKNALDQWLFWLAPNTLPNPSDLIEMNYRGLIDDGELDNAMRKLGYSAEWIIAMTEAFRPLLNASDYIIAERRGFIDLNTMTDKLTELKLDAVNIQILKDLADFFPSPTDLVQFAVREVYTPEIVDKFGMMQDIPEEFLTNAKKAGLPDEQARNFWAAHWALPSPLQGFRMLHRNIIDEDDLKLLLKSLDVMPFWRDKLVQLSFNPLTRVDVRRMYGLGVLDSAGVTKAYRDIGYNDENADLMTEFTIEFQNDENKGITRSSVVSAYKKGAISQEELSTYLKLLRYSDKVINFWVNSAVHDKLTVEVDDLINIAISSYANGIISQAEMSQELASIGLPAFYIDDLKRKAELERRKRGKMPPKDDLIKWLVGNTISSEEFATKMMDIGFRPADIDLYIDANPPKES